MSFPGSVWPVVREGIERLIDYQDRQYAQLYVERLAALGLPGNDQPELSSEAARHLALWMSYEDVIRVAQLKTRPARLQRIRRSHSALRHQPLVVVDYLKPGASELCGMLPPTLGRSLKNYLASRKLDHRLSVPLRVRTTSILGFAQLRLLALLRRWRRHSYGFHEEQRLIEAWLQRVRIAAVRDARFAMQVVQCAELVRGYADTRLRGYVRLQRIYDAVIDPILGGRVHADPASDLQRARLAAAADDTGAALEKELALHSTPATAAANVVQLRRSMQLSGA